jgi:hypothetical protein
MDISWYSWEVLPQWWAVTMRKRVFYPYYYEDLYMCVYYCIPEAISFHNHQWFASQIDCCPVFLPTEFSKPTYSQKPIFFFSPFFLFSCLVISFVFLSVVFSGCLFSFRSFYSFPSFCCDCDRNSTCWVMFGGWWSQWGCYGRWVNVIHVADESSEVSEGIIVHGE